VSITYLVHHIVMPVLVVWAVSVSVAVLLPWALWRWIVPQGKE
jgi:hypothetical protein